MKKLVPFAITMALSISAVSPVLAAVPNTGTDNAKAAIAEHVCANPNLPPFADLANKLPDFINPQIP